MSIYRLPLCYQTDITTQCTVFNRLAVAQTDIKRYESWIQTHPVICLDTSHNVVIEDSSRNWNNGPYSSLFYFENRWAHAEQTIDQVIACITEKKYILCNYAYQDILRNRYSPPIEILFYGYDSAARIFYTPQLDPNNGKMRESILPFAEFLVSTNHIMKHYCSKLEHSEANHYFFFKTMQNRPHPLSDPAIPGWLTVVQRELKGMPNSSTGCSVLMSFANYLDLCGEEIAQDSLVQKSICTSFGRLYEYYRLYIKRLRIFSAKQKIDADKLINVLNEVVESCHICYSLAFKATEDHDPHIYSRLAHYTRTLYQRVVPSMSDFYIYLQKL